MKLSYQAPGLVLELSDVRGHLKVWRSEPGGVLEAPLQWCEAAPALAEEIFRPVERAAREAGVLHLPDVVGTPWPGATTRRLIAEDAGQVHTTVMHVRSGLPELLHKCEAALWDAARLLERAYTGQVSAETLAPAALAAGEPLLVRVRVYRRRDAVSFAPAPAAELVLTQGARTTLREPVELVDDTPAARSPSLWRTFALAAPPAAPAGTGTHEVRVALAGPVDFPDGREDDGVLVAAPALLVLR